MPSTDLPIRPIWSQAPRNKAQLTFALDFIRSSGPDDLSGLELDLKRPPLGSLRLFGVKEREHGAQLEVPVEIVHLGVAQGPGDRSIGGEARGRSHFPCLFFSSFQNNSQPPGPEEDTLENQEEKRASRNNITAQQRQESTHYIRWL